MKLKRRPVQPVGMLATELEHIAERFRMDQRLLCSPYGLGRMEP
jgi:hypothetical protein